MNAVNFTEMPMDKLVAFYNNYSEKPIKRFSDRRTAEKRCQMLWEELEKTTPQKVMKQKADITRVAMQASLKLDRRIRCEETGEEWKNAHQMWKENPGYMTSAQQDRLTKQLYAAAKEGQRVAVKVNDLHFSLVNVEEQ